MHYELQTTLKLVQLGPEFQVPTFQPRDTTKHMANYRWSWTLIILCKNVHRSWVLFALLCYVLLFCVRSLLDPILNTKECFLCVEWLFSQHKCQTSPPKRGIVQASMLELGLRTWDYDWSGKSQLPCSQRWRLHRLTSSDLGLGTPFEPPLDKLQSTLYKC